MLYNELYKRELTDINNCNLPWNELQDKTVLITGATGLICSVLVDTLIYRNEYLNAKVNILILARSESSIKDRFYKYLNKEYFEYIVQEIEKPIKTDKTIDFIVHGASKGDPKSFALNPVGIMNANYIGTYQILELARKQNVQKVLFISSGEIYGVVQRERGSVEGIKENEYGFIDILSPRSSYAISKRAGETLCSSYYQQYNVNYSIGRPCHTYGPSMQENDSRVICEFFRSALYKKNIVLKSAGTQIRSYCYVADTIKGLLYILLLGKVGEAYNIANKNSTITIHQLAEKISHYTNCKINYEEANNEELRGFSEIKHAILDARKLEELGWNASYSIEDGIARTLKIINDK